jgi:hypothetical protein
LPVGGSVSALCQSRVGLLCPSSGCFDNRKLRAARQGHSRRGSYPGHSHTAVPLQMCSFLRAMPPMELLKLIVALGLVTVIAGLSLGIHFKGGSCVPSTGVAVEGGDDHSVIVANAVNMIMIEVKARFGIICSSFSDIHF